MLTVNELAEKLGVSRQTVYNAIKNAGISLDILTAEKQGNKRFFRDDAVDTVKKILVKDVTNESTVNYNSYTVKSKIESLTLENDYLKNRLDSMKSMVDKLEVEKQFLLQHIGQLTDAVKAANVVSAQLMKSSESKKNGLLGSIKRLFSGKTGNESGGEE